MNILRFIPFAAIVGALVACSDNKAATPAPNTDSIAAASDLAVAQEKVEEAKTYLEIDIPQKNTFVVISKKDLCLSVYGFLDGDTLLIARYPACLSKNLGQKQKSGDNKTPESEPGKPFKIKQIQNASTWKHDFGDGRGSIKAYGDWFLRLETGFQGIGIHGSSANESTVPGRDSEGCIRLRDKDIVAFKEKYAYVGMPVIIKQEDQGLLPFEEHLKNSKYANKVDTSAGASDDNSTDQPAAETPATETSATDASTQPQASTDAQKYLAQNKWTKDGLEGCGLTGLFEDLNNMDLDKLINQWGPKIGSYGRFAQVVEHAHRSIDKGRDVHRQGRTKYNKDPDDTVISVQGYLNWIDP